MQIQPGLEVIVGTEQIGGHLHGVSASCLDDTSPRISNYIALGSTGDPCRAQPIRDERDHRDKKHTVLHKLRMLISTIW